MSLRISREALWIELIAIFQKVQKVARFNHEMRAFANKMPEAATSVVSVRGNSLAWYGIHSSYSRRPSFDKSEFECLCLPLFPLPASVRMCSSPQLRFLLGGE